MKRWIDENFPEARPLFNDVRRKIRWSRKRARRRIARAAGDARKFTRRAASRGLPTDTIESRFRRIYRMNLWKGVESRCGPGSSLDETAVVRRELPLMIRDLGVRSLLDIPCGDFFWMKEVDLDLESYVGADVVSSLIEGNNQRYGSPDRMFLRLDILTDELPRADLVLCRDCLDHLSLANARRALENLVRSGSTYLLATTYTERDVNPDIQSGDWRPLNLEASPFCLPPPMEMINEGSSKPKYPDKSLGLWKIADVARATRRAQGDTARGT